METPEFRKAKSVILSNLKDGSVSLKRRSTGEDFLIAR